MQKRLSKFAFSGLVAVGLLAGSLASASAAVINTSGAVSGVTEGTARTGSTAHAGDPRAGVVKVNHRRHWRHHHRRQWRHHHRRHWHRDYYRPRTGIYFQFGSPGYYRPPPYYARPRYVTPRYAYPRHRTSGSHVEWCYARYRSYRAWDNTYQPYHGPRRQCISPY